MHYPETIAIPANPSLEGLAEVYRDVLFSSAQGVDLLMTLILPKQPEESRRPTPLIVFIQGSGWTFPKLGHELAQLSWYAQSGYAVATVTHRNANEGHAFPAYLQDVKTAVRFMRAHAQEYAIDPERICLWGTSSGGNTALLIGLTADDPRYKTEEYAQESDGVSCIIDCFGPTDLKTMLDENPDLRKESVFTGLLGTQDEQDVMRNMSPLCLVEENKDYPPFLLIHGDADTLVPYAQSDAMYRLLHDKGYDARLIKVIGAPHEGSFWSRRLHGLIMDYLHEKLGISPIAKVGHVSYNGCV